MVTDVSEQHTHPILHYCLISVDMTDTLPRNACKQTSYAVQHSQKKQRPRDNTVILNGFHPKLDRSTEKGYKSDTLVIQRKVTSAAIITWNIMQLLNDSRGSGPSGLCYVGTCPT